MAERITYLQAYYRSVFEEYGVTDAAFEKCAFAANLAISARIDALVEELHPSPPKLNQAYFLDTPSISPYYFRIKIH